jgi:hypothetical protein
MLRRITLKRTEMTRSAKPMRRTSRMKASSPTMTPARKAARGQDCTLRIPGVCNQNPETVVLCHSNRLEHGKGMGIKADDKYACFGCSSCHDVLDGRANRPDGLSHDGLQEIFDRAMNETQDLLNKGK